MKRLIITAICVILSLGAHAKSMEEIWGCIPDSIIPYIDRAHRVQMTEYIRMGLKGDVDNSLAGKSVIDTLTADYIHLTLNESAIMELKKLPWNDSDSLLCVVTTWKGPAEESTVRFYSQDWKAINLPNAFNGKNFANLADNLTQKPDTMDEKRFSELRSMIDPVIVGAHLSPSNNQLKVRLALPLLSGDDKTAVESIMHEVVLSWNGIGFQKVG